MLNVERSIELWVVCVDSEYICCGQQSNKDSSDRMLALPNLVNNQDNKKWHVWASDKHYNSMADTWKHGMDKHGIAIQATLQSKMGNESELFPVFVDGLMQQAGAANKLTSV
jgi:hypothetical protein